MPEKQVDIEYVAALARRRRDVVVIDACARAKLGYVDALIFVARVDRGDEPIVWEREWREARR